MNSFHLAYFLEAYFLFLMIVLLQKKPAAMHLLHLPRVWFAQKFFSFHLLPLVYPFSERLSACLSFHRHCSFAEQVFSFFHLPLAYPFFERLLIYLSFPQHCSFAEQVFSFF